jgi:hypothetical protein
LALALIVSYFLPILKKKRLRIEEEAG